MTELSPETRALLAAAREGLAPDAAAIKRVRGKVEATIAAPALGGGFAAKLGVVGLVAALALGAAVYTNRANEAAGAASSIAPPLVLPAPIEPIRPVVVSLPAASAPTIEMAPVSMRRRARAEPAASAVAALAVPATPATPAADGGIDLAREVELIDQAMAALRRGDATAAFAALRTHATETAGAGQLAEDAAAIEIEALCARDASATTIAAKLAAFDRRFPRSAQRSRLRCRD